VINFITKISAKKIKALVDIDTTMDYSGDELKQFVHDKKMRTNKEKEQEDERGRKSELEKLKLETRQKEIEALAMQKEKEIEMQMEKTID